MYFIQRIKPELALRLGLGLTHLYSGQYLIRHPTAWFWAVPFWLREIIAQALEIETYLKIQGVIEIIFALVLLAWFIKGRPVFYVALLSTLEFTVILLLAFLSFSEVNFFITFRDIGLLGAASALLIIYLKKERPNEVGPQ